MAKPIKMAHAVFRTDDIERLQSWWCTVLDARVVHNGGFISFISYDDEHHRLAFVNRGKPGRYDSRQGTLEHIAYSMGSFGDLLDLYERLKTAGIMPVRTINHGPTTSIYYADPDGNGVEFQIENYATMAECMDFMRSETFEANPIGVDFDADVLVERFRRGDPLEELVKQGSAPAPVG
ncbi:VOC family protein [Candidatus Poriferisodalis sp.]|uniref:VOC family protein n=1 Tax=Candidatus Poriferisodalis sp. TaxID=3101277 RepID=UPI003B01BE50